MLACFSLLFWLQKRTNSGQRFDFINTEWLQDQAGRIALILLVAFILVRLLRIATDRLVRLSRSHELPQGVRAQQLRTLASVINSVGVFIIFSFALMQLFSTFGVDMRPLLASAGIVGLAIGFGAQTLVKDVINGFFILLENQYDIGDVVRIAGVKGTVEDMTMRRTILRDADGTLHVIPNSEIKIVSNMTRDWSQVALHVPVAYDESSDRVIMLLQEIGKELRNDLRFAEMIVADPEVPGIERVSGGEVDYLMLVKTLPGAPQYTVSRELRRRIKERFEKEKIRTAAPARVYVMDAETREQQEVR
ncbi:MAG: mechanosensitive ion channel family protein [Acidobacteriales bacterium]|nr:mechanosensitive ion channel family protein [Terriglobales bacterium]